VHIGVSLSIYRWKIFLGNILTNYRLGQVYAMEISSRSRHIESSDLQRRWNHRGCGVAMIGQIIHQGYYFKCICFRAFRSHDFQDVKSSEYQV